MSKNVWIIIGIVLLTAIVVGMFLLLNQQQSRDLSQPTPAPVTTDNLTPVAPENGSFDWESYSSPTLGFTINHPEDVEVQTIQDGSVSFIRIGPTQTQGTELFDGFNITISKATYSPTSYENFRAFVESERMQKENDPTTQSIGALEEVTIAGKEGFQYVYSSLGDYTFIYLPDMSNEFYFISKIVVDPTDLGFEATVNTMLSSLSF